ncbi:hypothetical protein QUA81_33595 [Microcoleus sp. F6_B4]
MPPTSLTTTRSPISKVLGFLAGVAVDLAVSVVRLIIEDLEVLGEGVKVSPMSPLELNPIFDVVLGLGTGGMTI